MTKRKVIGWNILAGKSLESTINEWLRNNPNIAVMYTGLIHASQADVTLIIFYKED